MRLLSAYTATTRKAITSNLGHTVHSATSPMMDLQIDFLTGLTTSAEGYTVILVVICSFTRYVQLYACTGETAEETARCLDIHAGSFGHYPASIRSDQAPAFTSDLLAALAERMSFKHTLTVPHAPTTHGIVERSNREITKHLQVAALAANDVLQARWPLYTLRTHSVHCGLPARNSKMTRPST